MKQKMATNVLVYTLVSLGALIMVYPLIWLFFATFKPDSEIFTPSSIIPTQFLLSGYIDGWRGSGQYTFTTYFLNTFKIVFPMVFFSVLSSSLVAYGFARFRFVGKKLFFGVMICTMMLPSSVMLIPRYVMYRDLGWLDTYLPFIVPCIFAGTPFFVFMLIQFFRGIPRDLDESAHMDGCNSLRLFFSIILPLSKPALFSVAMFQFMWAWNDFFNPLIYINSVSKYPLALGLRMTMDTTAAIAWNNILAMALLSIMPMVLLFFFAQKYFVEGIATTGMKG
jgi:oligogalacturonide transport system permease protein